MNRGKKKKVSPLTELRDKVSSLESTVCTALSEMRKMSTPTMQQYVGDRVLLNLLQMSLMDDIDMFSKETRAEVMLKIVSDAVLGYSKSMRGHEEYDFVNLNEFVDTSTDGFVKRQRPKEPVPPAREAPKPVVEELSEEDLIKKMAAFVAIPPAVKKRKKRKSSADR